MANRLNLANNRYTDIQIYRYPITDILLVLAFTDTDNWYIWKSHSATQLNRYIGKPICHPWIQNVCTGWAWQATIVISLLMAKNNRICVGHEKSWLFFLWTSFPCWTDGCQKGNWRQDSATSLLFNAKCLRLIYLIAIESNHVCQLHPLPTPLKWNTWNAFKSTHSPNQGSMIPIQSELQHDCSAFPVKCNTSLTLTYMYT